MKQYKKEGLGRIDGSISAEGISTLPHSPEQEKRLQKLVEQIQPLFMQNIQQAIELYIDDRITVNQGDIIQYIVNYITKKYYTTGLQYTAGNGIKISRETISVRPGDGLEAASGDLNVDLATNPGLQITGSKLEAKPYTSAAMDKDTNGIKLVLSSDVETGAGASGGGLSFDGTSGVRVNPEDFLYLGS